MGKEKRIVKDRNKKSSKLNKQSNKPEKQYSRRRNMNIEVAPAKAMALTKEKVWSWHEEDN